LRFVAIFDRKVDLSLRFVAIFDRKVDLDLRFVAISDPNVDLNLRFVAISNVDEAGSVLHARPQTDAGPSELVNNALVDSLLAWVKLRVEQALLIWAMLGLVFRQVTS